MKSVCGKRPASVPVSPPLPTYGPSWIALEPRIMFDGAAVATAGTVIVDQVAQRQADTATSPDHATTTDHTPNAAPTGESPRTGGDQALFDALAAYDTPMARQEIAFLSPSVRDYQHLLNGISSNVEVVVLDPTRDGVTQIAETFATRTSVDAVHLIAEGTEAELHLGASMITQESLSTTYAQQFRQIGQSLTQRADILVYGCNFGRGKAGQLAISTLASLTGADVAASTDLTGAAGLGGDWTLEVNTGVIESDIAVTAQGQTVYGEVLDITTGLLGHWTFDSNANDSSGNNYNGTLTNGAFVDGTDATDIVGIAKLSLDISNDYVDLSAHKGSFEFLSQGTVAMWIKTTGTSADLFDIGKTTVNSSVASLWITGSGKLSFEVWENNSAILRVNSVASVNDGQWHHVAATVNTSGNKLYIDGVQASVTYSQGNSSTTAFYDDVTGINNMQIGRFSHSAGNGLYYTGLIDDIRVYNRALSSGDMGELYATGNDAPTITNLAGDTLAYSEGDGAVVLEQGGNAAVTDVDSADFNTGTLTVSFMAGSDSTEDVLSVRHQGTGPGQIGVSGATVTYGGTTIGTVAGGSGGANLVITLNSSATPTAVTALAKNITYENTDTAAPTTGARTVRYVLTDGDGGTSANYDITVTVSGVNDAPMVTSNGGGAAASINVAENNTAVTTVAATDVDAGQTLSYSLAGGADQALFTIDTTTGALSFNTAPNFEVPTDSGGNNVCNVTVQVNDGNGGIDTQALAITVTNLNEAPIITSNGGGASASANITENTTAVTTVTATETDFGQTLTYSLSGGADQAFFTIDSNTGVLTFISPPDFETPADSGGNNVYDVTVQVTDGDGGTDTQDLAVTVTNVNAAPVITSNGGGASGNTDVEEHTTIVTTVTATDVDGGQILTYRLNGGADQAFFTIDSSTGVLSFISAPDFEVPTDSGGNNVYDVTVQVDDGNGGIDTQALAVTVTDVNVAPVITSNGGGASASINVAENNTAVTTAAATDVDAGQILTYSLSGGADQALFTIDTTTGVLSFLAAPNFEVPTDSGADNVYDVAVQVDDGEGGIDMQTLAVMVTNVNEAPVITGNGGGASASINVAENNTAVTSVIATDVDDGQTLTYSLSGGADTAEFTIDSDTGALSFVTAPNFEGPTDSGGNNVYDVTVLVSDGNGGTDTQALAVMVTNVNEAPVITGNGGGASASINVAENNTAVTSVTTTDVDAGQTLTYSLGGGADQTLFAIDSNSGVLTFLTEPDYEISADTGGNNVYDVTVQVSDGNGGIDTQTLAVTVTNVNELPVVTSNGGGTSASINVAENGTDVTSVTATDVDDGQTLTYSINGGADQGLFTIDVNTGVLSFNTAPNFEVPTDSGGNNVYNVTVQVSDGNGGTDTQSLAVTVTDVNEAPVITSNGGGASGITNMAENSTAVTMVTATDVDAGQTLTYSLSGGADAAEFTIDSSTGALSFLTAPNFEAPTDSGGDNTYDVTVQVDDSNGGTDTQTLAIVVTNANDAPVVAANTGFMVAQGGTASITLGELQVTDVDNTPVQLTYTVTVGPVNGQLQLSTALGIPITGFTQAQINAGEVVYVHNGSLTTGDAFTFTVSDGAGGNIAATTFGITVTGVNNTPTLAVNGGSTVVQGLPDVITAGELQVIDLNNTPAQLIYTVTTVPSNGQLELTTNPGVVITTFTQADIDAGHVVFVHSGAVAASDSFTFTVSDGSGGTIGTTRFAFTVAPFIPPPGDGGGSSGAAGGSGGTGGTGLGSGSRSGSDTGSTPGRSNGIIPPQLELTSVPMGTAGLSKEVSVVGATHDLPPRTVMATRLVARIEPPGIAAQELPKLSMEQPSPPIKKVLVVGHKLVEQLTRLADDLERGVQERESQTHLMGRVASFSGVALSAGFVAWILRGGSLIASFLVSMPAWRRFDPLPVLWLGESDRRKRDRTAREADEHEKRQFRGLDRVLKSSNHGPNRQNRRP
ncbi:MAG: cadherin domain-containing protein [Nitrospira sp.]